MVVAQVSCARVRSRLGASLEVSQLGLNVSAVRAFREMPLRNLSTELAAPAHEPGSRCLFQRRNMLQ